jgi:hypothetical protein
MPKDFKYWKTQHDGEELKEFNTSLEGQLWLKTKSLTRRETMNEFIEKNGIELTSKKLSAQFPELFTLLSKDVNKYDPILNEYFDTKNAEDLKKLKVDDLIKELYKVDNFKWGADAQNDLGKYLVKRYIKDNHSYDFLIKHMDNGIMKTVQDYLVCSWYNHWSSIVIEHVFKTHDIVLPTVGKIKSVDFFMNKIPFDLKVTYLPIFYVEEERKAAGLNPKEIQPLKDAAKKLKIKSLLSG